LTIGGSAETSSGASDVWACREKRASKPPPLTRANTTPSSFIDRFRGSRGSSVSAGRTGGPGPASSGYNKADINCNGAVNAQDTTLFRQLLGSPPGPSGLTP